MSPARLSFVLSCCLAASGAGLPVSPLHAADAVPAAAEADPAAASAADPLETLRQRLAERLSRGRASPGATPGELQVVTRSAAATAAAAAPSTDRGAGARLSRARASAVKPPGDGDPVWSYDGPAGPQAWATLAPDYAACARGRRQSPIDLRGGLPVDLEPIRFDYRASRFAVVDTGRTIRVDVAAGNAIAVGGRRYALRGFHFHRPGENRIDGRAFEMSLHLEHRDDEGRVAMVALLIDRGLARQPVQPVVQQVWNHLPLERHRPNAASVEIDPAGLLPADRGYYTYMGSRTTPPCTEDVRWFVMRSPVTLPPEQIDLFARLYPMNARPLQADAGRRILQSN